MTQEEQKRITHEILERIEADIKRKIDSGKIPQEWNGIELREYISDQVRIRPLEKKRLREYRNTVAVNGL